MKLANLLAFIEANELTLSDSSQLENDIQYIATADLMSDLLALVIAPSGQTVLVTGLANGSCLRTVEMLDIQNIIFCRNKHLSDDHAKMAAEMNINTFTTKLPMFDVIGILYHEGLRTATRLPHEA
jgi:hypothetical protein